MNFNWLIKITLKNAVLCFFILIVLFVLTIALIL